MAKLGFCGLGQMGAPMARRLLEAGHDLTVWNRTRDKAERLAALGATIGSSPGETARGAEGVITMVSTPEALKEVAFGREGLSSSLSPGATLIEMSTVGAAAVRDLAGRLPGGVDVLDAPVRGSVPQAESGELDIVAGGSEETFDRWRPVLEVLGHPLHMGPLGAGASMKLVSNLTLGAVATTLGEALALADALGLEQQRVLDALEGSPIAAYAARMRPIIESGEYPPRFKLSLAHKDMRLVGEAAAEGGVDLPMATAATGWMRSADASGLGERDYSAVIAHIWGAGTS